MFFMVDLQYVKERRRKRIAAITACVSSVLITIFVVISFLGQKTGSFTVKLRSGDVNLTLSTSSDFKESSSYLRVDKLYDMDCYCYQDFKNADTGLIDFSNIDNEETSYEIGAYRDSETNEIMSLGYFKYTFFVKNIGSNSARYDMSIKIVSNSQDSDTQKRLDSFLRAAVIHNGESTVYAKRSNDATHYATETPDVKSTLEYIDGDHDSYCYEGLAESFVSGKEICNRHVKDFDANEVDRYTLVFWLEGDDADATGIAPKDCKLRLGVEIQAYEN